MARLTDCSNTAASIKTSFVAPKEGQRMGIGGLKYIYNSHNIYY